MPSSTVEERFWSKVRKGPGCWEWLGSTRRGYGQFWLEGKNHVAHRVVLALIGKPLPAGVFGCHRCDNTRCVNPDHVFPGSTTDNVRDSIAKGRWNYQKRESELYVRGSKNHKTKLTEDQVREIRNVYRPRRVGSRWDVNVGPSRRELAAKYGVSKFAIDSVIRGLTWKHLK